MSGDARECLEHIEQAGRRVIAYTQGVTYGEYLEDDMRSAAVERQLIIIGEALRRLERLDWNTAQQIADRRRIIKSRNALVHRFEHVRHTRVWIAAQINLPRMLGEVESLLEDHDTPQEDPPGAAP